MSNILELVQRKVEFITKKIFQNARVLRMDFDTTRRKDSYSKFYDEIKTRMSILLLELR